MASAAEVLAGAGDADPGAVPRAGGRGPSPAVAVVVVAFVGVLVTGLVSWTAWKFDGDNERQLLQSQTRQAAAVLGSTVLSIRDPLAAAVQVQEATGGDASQFLKSMASSVGTGKLFAAATLFRVDGGGTATPVVTVGDAARLAPDSAQVQGW